MVAGLALAVMLAMDNFHCLMKIAILVKFLTFFTKIAIFIE